MLFSLNWLKEHIQGQLPAPDKLQHLLNMHIFEVEGKKQKKGDWVFDIDVPMRRGDAAAHYGLARELAALLSKQLKKLPLKPLKKEKGSLPLLKIKVQSPYVYRYSAIVLEGIRISKSPQWLKDRLELLNINSINSIVDVTNYIMAELGQPLHAFDYDTLKDHQMIIREAKEGEKIETLDNLTFKLQKGMLVIEDKNRLIDLAGIKGGECSGIKSNTKNVILQAASFSGKQIYKTTKQLGYTTPAADIYMHELDPNATIKALERAVELLKKLGSVAKIVQIIDIYPKKRIAKKLLLDFTLVKQYLGISIPKNVVVQILKNLGFKVKSQKSKWEIIVPTFRQDITMPQDLIEEIARMYGYEKIDPIFPVTSLSPSLENRDVRFKEKMKDALLEAGFTETYNYSFIGEKDIERFEYKTKDKAALVGLQNSYSEEYKYLRPNLIENLLKVIGENTRRLSGKDIRIFELGKAFLRTKGKIAELDLATGVIALSKKNDQIAFAEAKGIIDFILSRLGIIDSWYDSFDQTPLHSRITLWHEKKAAEIKVGQKKIGFLGIISPKIAANLKLKGSIAIFSLDIQKLLPLFMQEWQYQTIPRFPAVFRDLAILVPYTTRISEVMNIINTAETKLVSDVDLFDMYEGEHIPEGQKNLAFHLIYQSQEKTLTAKEVDSVHQKIISALEKNPSWEVRK